MYQLESILEVIEEILNIKRKRHIAGGILISLAVLFGGLAATALTIRPEEKENDDYE